MAKRCPECGARFPDAANVCDQHGVELTREPRVPRVIWVAVVAGLAALPFLLGMYWSACLEARITKVQLEKAGKEKGNEADLVRWLVDKRVAVQVEVKNGSMLPIAVEEAAYRVRVNGAEAVVGVWRGAALGAGMTTVVEWQIPLADAALRGAMAAPPAAGVPVEVEADFRIRLFGFAWPARLRQRISVHPSLAP